MTHRTVGPSRCRRTHRIPSGLPQLMLLPQGVAGLQHEQDEVPSQISWSTRMPEAHMAATVSPILFGVPQLGVGSWWMKDPLVRSLQNC